MEVIITGAVRRASAKLQSNHHHQQTTHHSIKTVNVTYAVSASKWNSNWWCGPRSCRCWLYHRCWTEWLEFNVPINTLPVIMETFLQCFRSWLGDRKGIRPVKNWVLVCWWWQFDWNFVHLVAPVVTTTSIILSSNKIQNGDILVPANPGPPGKWSLKWRENQQISSSYSQMTADPDITWLRSGKRRMINSRPLRIDMICTSPSSSPPASVPVSLAGWPAASRWNNWAISCVRSSYRACLQMYNPVITTCTHTWLCRNVNYLVSQHIRYLLCSSAAARPIAPVVTTTSITLSSNKIQNGDILVPVNPGSPGKWPLKCREKQWPWSRSCGLKYNPTDTRQKYTKLYIKLLIEIYLNWRFLSIEINWDDRQLLSRSWHLKVVYLATDRSSSRHSVVR